MSYDKLISISVFFSSSSSMSSFPSTFAFPPTRGRFISCLNFVYSWGQVFKALLA